MIFKDYFKEKFNKDLSEKENKKFFFEKCLKQSDYKYSGTCAEYGIVSNSVRGLEYEAAFGKNCHYISSQELGTPFTYDGKSYAVIGVSQRLFGKLLSSNSGKGINLNVLFDAEIVVDDWVDDDGVSQQTLKLRCKAQQQASTLQVDFDA